MDTLLKFMESHKVSYVMLIVIKLQDGLVSAVQRPRLCTELSGKYILSYSVSPPRFSEKLAKY